MVAQRQTHRQTTRQRDRHSQTVGQTDTDRLSDTDRQAVKCTLDGQTDTDR